MKHPEDFVGYCTYCKEEIYPQDGYVFAKNKFYHLICYHLIIDYPLDPEIEEMIE